MVWLSAGAELRIDCHVGAFIRTPPPNNRIERHMICKVPSSGMSTCGAHAERWTANKSADQT